MSNEKQITLIGGLDQKSVQDAKDSKSKKPVQVKLTPGSWDHQCVLILAKMLGTTKTEAVRVAIRATTTTLLRAGGKNE